MLHRRRQTSAGGCRADHAVPARWRPEPGAGEKGPHGGTRYVRSAFFCLREACGSGELCVGLYWLAPCNRGGSRLETAP